VAKYGTRLRCWRAIEADGKVAQMPYVSNGRKVYTAAAATTTTTTSTATNRRMERIQ
jgi:hypothetical protein